MREIFITATVRFDIQFSPDADIADSQRAEFMTRAQKTIIAAGMPLLDENSLEGVNEILTCFDLEYADTDETRYVVPIKNRDCAERLLLAGLLDQTADAIVERWGPVRPSTRRRS